MASVSPTCCSSFLSFPKASTGIWDRDISEISHMGKNNGNSDLVLYKNESCISHDKSDWDKTVHNLQLASAYFRSWKTREEHYILLLSLFHTIKALNGNLFYAFIQPLYRDWRFWLESSYLWLAIEAISSPISNFGRGQYWETLCEIKIIIC